MTKAAALQAFFSAQGTNAYPAAAVPQNATLPYLSYTLATAAWEDGPVALTVELWDYTRSETPINAQAQRLSAAIGRGGKLLRCDGGYIWLTRGAPWCLAVRDEGDDLIKRRQINVKAEYLTAD